MVDFVRTRQCSGDQREIFRQSHSKENWCELNDLDGYFPTRLGTRYIAPFHRRRVLPQRKLFTKRRIKPISIRIRLWELGTDLVLGSMIFGIFVIETYRFVAEWLFAPRKNSKLERDKNLDSQTTQRKLAKRFDSEKALDEYWR